MRSLRGAKGGRQIDHDERSDRGEAVLPIPAVRLHASSTSRQNVGEAFVEISEHHFPPLAAEEQLDEDLQLIQGELSGAVSLSDASCGKVCRALGSMGNAVRRLCQLAGDDVARCKRAESKLTKASKRVRGAGCGC